MKKIRQVSALEDTYVEIMDGTKSLMCALEAGHQHGHRKPQIIDVQIRSPYCEVEASRRSCQGHIADFQRHCHTWKMSKLHTYQNGHGHVTPRGLDLKLGMRRFDGFAP